MTATPQLSWRKVSSKVKVLIFHFGNDPQQGYLMLMLQDCQRGPEKSSHLTTWPLSNQVKQLTTQAIILKGDFGLSYAVDIMSLWQRAGVSCSTASEHKCSWHKWRKFFSVWLCLLDGCYSVLTGNNAIQKFKGRWGSWASAKAADYSSNSNSNYESKNITLPQVKTTLNNDRKIPWVHSYRRSY